ncbi:serine palmitoyltransferase component [Sarracenia purpurea var. burkii]
MGMKVSKMGYLSRSTIVYFKHNDMESLQSTSEKVAHEHKRAKKLIRRYIVVEAVYQVYWKL